MEASQIYEGLAEKSISAEELAKRTIADPALVQQLVDGMAESKAEIKYGCAKTFKGYRAQRSPISQSDIGMIILLGNETIRKEIRMLAYGPHEVPDVLVFGSPRQNEGPLM